jgi:hypothetical protein
MGGAALLVAVVLAMLAGAQGQSINAVFSFGGAVQEVSQCCSQNPTWFSLWETLDSNSSGERLFFSCLMLGQLVWTAGFRVLCFIEMLPL